MSGRPTRAARSRSSSAARRAARNRRAANSSTMRPGARHAATGAPPSARIRWHACRCRSGSWRSRAHGPARAMQRPRAAGPRPGRPAVRPRGGAARRRRPRPAGRRRRRRAVRPHRRRRRAPGVRDRRRLHGPDAAHLRADAVRAAAGDRAARRRRPRWPWTACPTCSRGRLHPQRLLWVLSDAWFAVGPAVVFLLAGVRRAPSWSDWPIYLARARRAVRAATCSARRRANGSPTASRPKLQLDVLREVWLVDALLAPVGLLAAFVERRAATTPSCSCCRSRCCSRSSPASGAGASAPRSSSARPTAARRCCSATSSPPTTS